ncbi:MAG: sugar-binding transcriptional regulator [Actinobacteria bacterium]|nr:sugar-binding transcriptional regulator [Actinomycetota bacterium]
MEEELKLTIKICKLFYNDGLNLGEISQKLKISRYRIARNIEKAKRDGVVRIEIFEPYETMTDLENEFEKKYKLKRAVIVENKGLSNSELKSKLGQAGANLLNEILADGDVLGVSWGSTLKEVLDALPLKINKKIEVVQMTSGSDLVSIDMICHDLTKQLADRFDTKPHLLFAPNLVDSAEVRKLIVSNSSISKTFQLFDRITIAIFGIGLVNFEFLTDLLKAGEITTEDLDILIRNSAVGDIFSNFYDVNGKLCDKKMVERLVTIPIEKLRSIPYAIGVAGGTDKAAAILGAIRSKYINVLVTDNITIREIQKLDI